MPEKYKQSIVELSAMNKNGSTAPPTVDPFMNLAILVLDSQHMAINSRIIRDDADVAPCADSRAAYRPLRLLGQCQARSRRYAAGCASRGELFQPCADKA